MTGQWTIVLVLVMMVPIVFITTVMPFLTRKIESFGVTIPEEAQKDSAIIALRRQYLWLSLGLGSVVTASLLWFSSRTTNEEQWSVSLLSHVMGYMVFSFVIYLMHHYAVKRLKEQKQWKTGSVQQVMINTKFRNNKLTLSYLWFIPHVFLILATILTGVWNYELFPAQIPMKFGMDGEVVRSVEKSYISVLWPALIQAFLLILFMLSNFSISRSKQIVEASDPEGSLARNAIFRRYWSAYIIISGFLIMGMFGFILISTLQEWDGNTITFLTLAVTGVMVLSAIILSMITGQGGSRIKLGGGSQQQSATMADQDHYWKLGQIYFNPQDPSIFVEKRFGIGWTINFARPISWIAIVGLIAIIRLLIFVIETNS